MASFTSKVTVPVLGLGIHTASICFDTWYEYKQLLGGVWRRDQSFHPPQGEVEVRPVAGGHWILEDIPTFTVNDEIYHELDIAPDTRVLMEGRVLNGSWQPVGWYREVGDGRVFYDALGHDGESLRHPEHARLIQRGVRWLLKEEGCAFRQAREGASGSIEACALAIACASSPSCSTR